MNKMTMEKRRWVTPQLISLETESRLKSGVMRSANVEAVQLNMVKYDPGSNGAKNVTHQKNGVGPCNNYFVNFNVMGSTLQRTTWTPCS